MESKNVALELLCVMTVMYSVSSQTIGQPPSHSVARTGESFNFTCRVDNPDLATLFEWVEYITSAGGHRIYSVPEYPPPLDSSKYAIFGTYDLNIKSPIWRDGGKYACRLLSNPNGQEADLYVFETHTMSAVKMMEGQLVQLPCEARFGADPSLFINPANIPTMRYRLNGVEVTNVVTKFTTATGDTPNILRGLGNYTARSMDDGEDFVCVVTVNYDDTAGYEVTDSITLDIEFPTEPPIFRPENTEFFLPGEMLNCTAEGNPEPTYEWTAMTTPSDVISQTGSTLYLTEDMVNNQDNQDDVNTWSCTATNSLRAETSQITFVVIQSGDAQPSTTKMAGWKIGLAVAIPLAVIIIVIAIVVGCMLHKKRKKKQEATARAASKVPPPDVGNINVGAAFPGEGDFVNGKGPKISSLPNPLPEDVPANRSRDSPGYADLGVKQISNSYPGVNVSMNSSVDSFDDTHEYPPPQSAPPHGRVPSGQANPSYQSSTPPRNQRPTNLNVANPYVTASHPDTFV